MLFHLLVASSLALPAQEYRSDFRTQVQLIPLCKMPEFKKSLKPVKLQAIMCIQIAASISLSFWSMHVIQIFTDFTCILFDH